MKPASPSPNKPSAPPKEAPREPSLGRGILNAILCVADEGANRLFAVRQPWNWIRGFFFLLYLLWVLLGPFLRYFRLWPTPGLSPAHPFPEGSLLQWLGGLFRWEVLRFWALWGGSMALALHAAGRYLLRVFPPHAQGPSSSPGRAVLRAQKALLYRAFHPTYPWVLRIGQGRVQNPDSPLLWLGGPGRVQVATDSVAVFERFGTGDLRVVTPRPADRHGHPVGAYERLRRTFEIGPQHLAFDVQVRTADGVPLLFAGVRAVYGLRPGEGAPSPDLPFPPSEEAVLQLVRSERGRARALHGGLPYGPPRASQEVRAVEQTTAILRAALRGRLRRAVAQRTLPEVLAAIEREEKEQIERRTQEITSPFLAHPSDRPLPLFTPPPQPSPHRMHRYEMSALLRHAEGYHHRGVHLYWVDMNDWDVPLPGVRPQLVRLWALSRENQRRRSPVALEQVKQEAYLGALSAEFRRWMQLLDDAPGAGNPADLAPLVWAWLAKVRALLRDYLDREALLTPILTAEAFSPEADLLRNQVEYLAACLEQWLRHRP